MRAVHTGGRKKEGAGYETRGNGRNVEPEQVKKKTDKGKAAERKEEDRKARGTFQMTVKK